MAYARSKKSYLLDPRFQLKWTGYLVLVVVLVMAGLGVVIARVAGRASDTAHLAVLQAEKAFEESRTNSILAMRSVSTNSDDPTLAKVMEDSLVNLPYLRNTTRFRVHSPGPSITVSELAGSR